MFLDYDGTLADFSRTPDIIEPNKELIDLLTRLARNPQINLAVVSGRRLSHIRKLVPVPGIWLAGTYGIELFTPESRQIDRLDYAVVRPELERLKPSWEALLASYPGMYLEDKGWSLAIHARFAEDRTASQVLSSARELASGAINSTGLKSLGGHKFLEVCPVLADKGKAVEYILAENPRPGALAIFIGDDDKDERAFETIKEYQGIAILVSENPRLSHADCRLSSPSEVRLWLSGLNDNSK
jgi:trehalose-phosphatase